MVKFRLSVIICFLYSITTYAQPGFGNAAKINNNWQFHLGNVANIPSVQNHTKDWQKINLPHDWSVRQPLSNQNASCMGYLPAGIGWYQKNINVPANKKGEQVYIYFDGVYNRSDVYVNGNHIGYNANGYTAFMYDITPFVNYGGNNVIAVKVDHSRAADSRWYTGSGIYRDVWLVYANPIHIGQWGVHAVPEVNQQKGTLKITVDVENNEDLDVEITLKNTLYNSQGKIVVSATQNKQLQANTTNSLHTNLKVNSPERWNLDNPTLYKLKTIILKDGKEIDVAETTTGFRSFTFDADKGFALNGKWMKVKGVCLHHDAGVLGAAFYKDVWRRRLLALKEIGCNAIRTSHNPQATLFYELCDELGFLVLNEAFDEWEFPKRKWLQGWNVGTPGFEGSYDFFKTDGEKDLADFVRRDRNHISIFAWSIGNEVDYPNDPYSHPVLDGSSESGFTQKIFGGYKKDAPNAKRLGEIAQKLAAVVRKYDSSRPVTAGLAGVAMSNETAYPFALDIAGYNYTESRYMDDHKKYPTRIIYGSENRHDYTAWKAVTDNPHIFGQFLWTGIDYLGESGRWPSRGFYSGLIDFGGFIKPRGYFRQALWTDKPVAYIGTYPLKGNNKRRAGGDVLTENETENSNRPPSIDAWPVWNYKEGQLIRVVCYTNAPKAILLLNGKEVGAIKDYDNKTGVIYWDIPYKAGKLEVRGLDEEGKKLAIHTIQTTGEPALLRVKLLQKPAKDGICQLLVQVVDANNNLVRLAENEITVTINGQAILLGMEASNNSDMGDYTDNKQRVYQGQLVTYIYKPDNKKQVEVSVTTPQLKGAKIKF
ncbi:MAG: sugar-binding domain-containing protein [Niabella sp.]